MVHVDEKEKLPIGDCDSAGFEHMVLVNNRLATSPAAILGRIKDHYKEEHFRKQSSATQFVSIAISALETDLPFLAFDCAIRPKTKLTDKF